MHLSLCSVYVCVCVCALCRSVQLQLFVMLRTAARQFPLSMGFPRQEYWSWLSCPPPGDDPKSAIEPVSLISPALAGDSFTPEPPGKPLYMYRHAYLHISVYAHESEHVH